jgi:hypothetical protein
MIHSASLRQYRAWVSFRDLLNFGDETATDLHRMELITIADRGKVFSDHLKVSMRQPWTLGLSSADQAP